MDDTASSGNIIDRAIEKAKSAVEVFANLMIARTELAARRGHQIGPGRRSVLTLHRKIAKGQKYGPHNTRPYSTHARRRALD